jgi:hypothetical protein
MTDYDHASGGYSLLESDPGMREGLPEWAGLARLAAAVTGHHGAPPRNLSDLRTIFHRHGTTAAHTFACMLAALLPSPSPRLDRPRAIRTSFRLAGFAVLCDWIGSNENWFHYQHAEAFESLGHYWDYAREQADRAVAEAGVIPAASAPRRIFVELTGRGFEPSPMQRWAAAVALPEGSAPRCARGRDRQRQDRSGADARASPDRIRPRRRDLHRATDDGDGERNVRTAVGELPQPVHQGFRSVDRAGARPPRSGLRLPRGEPGGRPLWRQARGPDRFGGLLRVGSPTTAAAPFSPMSGLARSTRRRSPCCRRGIGRCASLGSAEASWWSIRSTPMTTTSVS